ncbi:MAG TPA: NapC/NirT family cytochrome c, partial [Anaerolineae bacterium]|nr:NapC/NirT family cytochrome c [Anaerolineae bacterium]
MKKALSIVAGIAILVIMLLGTGAVAYYSNNSNCRDCHEMNRSYDSWRTSTHSSVSCTSCHHRNPSERTVTTRGTAIARIFAHFVKAKKNPKAHIDKEHCLRCHSSIKKSIKAGIDGHVVNPHPVHLAAGYNCSHCHKRLVHPAKANENTRPQMSDCIKCHQLKEVSIECSTCHFGTQEHIDKIADTGGYTLKKGEGCKVCHTEETTNSINHKKAMENIGGYKGIGTCSKCHVYCAKSVESSVHSRLKTEVAHVRGIKEEMGMASRAANPGTWAYQLKGKDGSIKDFGCGQCHVGGSNLPTPQMASGIDCLICHAKNYDMKKRRIVKTGNAVKW